MANEALTASKLKIPTGWAVAVIGALGLGGTNVAVGHYRLGQAEKEIQELRAAKHDDAQRDLDIQKLTITLEFISKKLDEIDKKLSEDRSPGASQR